MKSLFAILKFIWNHPLASKNRFLAIRRFLSWQIGQRLRPGPKRVRFVEDSVLVAELGMVGATGNIYMGLLEFHDMAFLLHILKPGDMFVDVGANVGVYSVLAAKNAGADVISFEPIPSTFSKLQRNIEANGVKDRVDLKRYGVSDKPGSLHFTATMDVVNHVLKPGQQADPSWTVEVPVGTLDDLVLARKPVLCKIDVEGYEWPVLNGASSLLSSPSLKAVIIELNGSGSKFGFDEDKIHALFVSHGFAPYRYEPFSRQLKEEPRYYGHDNTIYIRDLEWVRQRIKASKQYNILNVKV